MMEFLEQLPSHLRPILGSIAMALLEIDGTLSLPYGDYNGSLYVYNGFYIAKRASGDVIGSVFYAEPRPQHRVPTVIEFRAARVELRCDVGDPGFSGVMAEFLSRTKAELEGFDEPRRFPRRR